MKILAFGDSITWGAWDSEGGWVSRIRKYVDAKVIASNFDYYCGVYNLGVSGNTSTSLLERFEREMKVRVEPGEDTIVLIAIGINDSLFFLKESRFKVSQEEFEQNIRKLIEISKKQTVKVVFIGLTQIEEEKLNPIPWQPNRIYCLEYVQQYNNILQRVCLETKTDFIDLIDLFPQQALEGVLSDGLHPSSYGHQLIGEKVQNFLLEKGWI